MDGLDITRERIRQAARRIAPYVLRTPLLRLQDAFGRGWDLNLKLDSTQPTGSFKVRGAFAALTAAVVPEVGVVAASGGNFGLATAYAARVLGHRATIFVPVTSPTAKIDPIRLLGAEIRQVAGYYAEALESSREWARESGALEIHAYDHAEVVAGQGTAGREIQQQAPSVETMLVAVGGGGLIGGIASWFRGEVKVVGVESELCPTLHRAKEEGGPVNVQVGGLAASSLGAARLGAIAWDSTRWIAESYLVSDEDILQAQRWIWATCRVVSEPGAAATVAALRSGRYVPAPGEQVVAVISGANTDPGSVV